MEGIEAAVQYVHSLVDAEVAAGTPAERIIIGGFSQGGCLALAAAFKYPQVPTHIQRVVVPGTCTCRKKSGPRYLHIRLRYLAEQRWWTGRWSSG